MIFMSVKIITDSGSDLPIEIIKKNNIKVIPLEITINNETFLDSVNISNEEFYKKMSECEELPKTASPSPQKFIKEFNCKEDHIFIVTLSSKLSSTYNNAILAKKLYEDENDDKHIYIIDSLSASVGEGLVVLKLIELLENESNYNTIANQTIEFAKKGQVYFLLETLDNIVKGGRIGKAAGHIASLLSIKLILKSDGNGVVDLAEKVRGSKRAFNRFVNLIGDKGNDFENKTLAIAHANCYQKALKYKEMVENKYNFKDIIISTIGATIGTYSGDDALLIAFL
jgi:DegV family protein with EDD domain